MAMTAREAGGLGWEFEVFERSEDLEHLFAARHHRDLFAELAAYRKALEIPAGVLAEITCATVFAQPFGEKVEVGHHDLGYSV